MDSAYLRPLLFFLSVAATVTFVSATDHIVGGYHGWNPNINYTPWANNQTFYVGDLICKSPVFPSARSLTLTLSTAGSL